MSALSFDHETVDFEDSPYSITVILQFFEKIFGMCVSLNLYAIAINIQILVQLSKFLCINTFLVNNDSFNICQKAQ